jgi:hypothetical protein
MFRILFCCVAIILVVMSGSVRALDLPPPTESEVRVPGTDYAIRLGTTHFREPSGAISQDLVAAIVTWLSAEFSLPIIEHQPVIKFVPAKEIVARRYNSILGPGRSAEDQNETVAIYHDPTQTIYLAQDWTGGTPAEQSTLDTDPCLFEVLLAT